MRSELPKLKEKRASTLDLRGGKVISAFILVQVVETLLQLKPGQSIDLATDAFEGLHADLLAWGRLTGHHVVQEEVNDTDYYRYKITKRDAVEESRDKKHLAIIVSQDGLEDLISPLGFALSGICSGMNVSLYFQGPGVHALHKHFKGRLSGWQAPFSGIARKKMAETGHEPPTKKLEQLHRLGAKLYACHPSLQVFGVPLEQTLFPDDIVLCEYATFLEVMQGATIKLYP